MVATPIPTKLRFDQLVKEALFQDEGWPVATQAEAGLEGSYTGSGGRFMDRGWREIHLTPTGLEGCDAPPRLSPLSSAPSSPMAWPRDLKDDLVQTGLEGCDTPSTLSPLSSAPSSPTALPCDMKDDPIPPSFTLQSKHRAGSLREDPEQKKASVDAVLGLNTPTIPAVFPSGCEAVDAPRTKKRKARKTSQKDASKRRRKAKNKMPAADWDAPPVVHKNNFISRDKHEAVGTDGFDIAHDYEAERAAFTATKFQSNKKIPRAAEALEQDSFERWSWRGGQGYTLEDDGEHIFLVLLPPPMDNPSKPAAEHWGPTCSRVAERFEQDRQKTSLPDNPRGAFGAVNVGVSSGQGSKGPHDLKHEGRRAKVVDGLLEDRDVRRIAQFQSEALASYFPKVYAEIKESMDTVSHDRPYLKRNFPRSIYPTVTFNLGPRSICEEHKDSGNAPGVPCAITALGSFDPDKGGEIYLSDLKLIIRFPPGCTILLSSACMRHGNLPIQDGERRYSLTQYCPGGLLRWARHGCRPAGTLSDECRIELEGTWDQRWAEVVGKFSTDQTLQEDRQWLISEEKRWLEEWCARQPDNEAEEDSE